MLAISAGACSSGDSAQPSGRTGHGAQQHPVLRAIYRDERAMVVLALPAPGSRWQPSGPCAQPLLIDPATGQAVVIGRAEALRRIATMQLSGATSGTCPAAGRAAR